jgi:DNA polymerase III subunit epsilon
MTRPAPPPRGSRRLPWRDASFAALDFELTGLDAARDDIVSFGVVPIERGRASIGTAAYREVRARVPSSVAAVKVHGLRSADLLEAPPIEDVSDELSAALAGRFVLAWVADVEIAFLRVVFGGSARWWRRRTIDVFELARAHERAAGGDGAPRPLDLTATADRFGVPLEDAHHAFGDALMTAELFLLLASKVTPGRGDRVRHLLRGAR